MTIVNSLKILEMDREQLLALPSVSGFFLNLTTEEIIHIATCLGAFWQYDYEAAKAGKFGLHAKLKSEFHSDGFLVSKIMLEPANIRNIMAQQLAYLFSQLGVPHPDFLIGIPDGATDLAKDMSEIMDVPLAEMKKDKISGRISLITPLAAGQSVLLVEDFCTKGTGFKEVVKEILLKQPKAKVLPYEMVVVNRGGMQQIVVEGAGSYAIISAATNRIEEWAPDDCPLCKMGSEAIKPKVSEESWRRITTSQL